MYNSRSVFSEDMLWSIFRFQISVYEFCPFVFVKNAPSLCRVGVVIVSLLILNLACSSNALQCNRRSSG